MFGLMPNGILRQANLNMLFERAKQYETASFKGLYNFIHFIERLRLSNGDMGTAKIIGENDNVVRIMSIHKSKGLEFPVVFLASTGKQVNLIDLNQNLLLHQELGVGVKYINYEKQVQYDTLSKSALRNQIFKETLSEEMRILYVALTRSKEKLIITGIKKDYEKQKEKLLQQIGRYPKNKKKINAILVKKYKTYLDWILLVFFYEQTRMETITELYVYHKKEILAFAERREVKEEQKLEELEKHTIKQERIKEIEQVLNHKYTYELATILPNKASVTQIKQKQEEVQEIRFPIPKFLQNNKEIKITAAQKGTLLHLCMQKLNEKEEYDLEKIKELILDLVKREIITQKEAENINPIAILEFTKSKIWLDMKKAKEIQKEKPFYITIPAKEVYPEAISEDIFVQGIIDLYYRNKEDKLILVDYKTDFVQTKKELIDKYEKQLRIYQKALEEAFHEKVDKVFIYSTHLGKEIQVL